MTSSSHRQSTGAIVMTVVLALGLSVFPLPESMEVARPAWMAVLVVFWTLHRPEVFGLIAAWVCGLLLDALQGTFLGQHALALTLTSALAGRFRLRMRVSPVSQQTLSVALMVAVYEFVLLWIDGIAGLRPGGFERFASALPTLVIWPLICLVSSPTTAQAAGE